MKRVLALYSGGLDSTLAIALMRRAGVEVVPITFVTPFTNPLSKTGQLDKGTIIAKTFQLELQKIPLLEELITLIKNPKFGHGKNINPCIDCHLLMLQKTKDLMYDFQADFVVTGEVLGQRPMSQNKQSLNLIAENSEIAGLLVRPLSARLLAPTIPQEKGWIAPEYLLDIKGRGRKQQIALAQEWGITDFGSPGGGCLLTDPGYSRKLKVLMDSDMLDVPNCHWIQFGRFFDLAKKCKVVVARNESECIQLEKLVLPDDILIEPGAGSKGPTALLRGEYATPEVERALGIVAYYCRSREKLILNQKTGNEQTIEECSIPPLAEAEVRALLVV
ncbi:tRNA 4-thiouridine(8) synthase ThiI [bacterium]|nr:tRNA 4-thiouridine(8) synthase ThiI [bacterium]